MRACVGVRNTLVSPSLARSASSKGRFQCLFGLLSLAQTSQTAVVLASSVLRELGYHRTLRPKEFTRLVPLCLKPASTARTVDQRSGFGQLCFLWISRNWRTPKLPRTEKSKTKCDRNGVRSFPGKKCPNVPDFFSSAFTEIRNPRYPN